MAKFELIVEYEGTIEGAFDFANEINDDFRCGVVVNEVDNDGNVITGLMDWDAARESLDKPDKGDKAG